MSLRLAPPPKSNGLQPRSDLGTKLPLKAIRVLKGFLLLNDLVVVGVVSTAAAWYPYLSHLSPHLPQVSS